MLYPLQELITNVISYSFPSELIGIPYWLPAVLLYVLLLTLFNIFKGISMTLLQSKEGTQYFTFEHGRQYQQVQFKFLDAVESMDPNNIVVEQVHFCSCVWCN